ncbi:MAG: UDP-N-acetylglucosamine 2-epimerase (non-hydrolyzing) [Bacteroidetes bacterium]|nr:UDP-N-acetylglucosamine 2-epimerase (non-hydrolyzing) [Bacteroidota bacterium]
MKKIITIVGARPQLIKAAPLSLKLKERFEEVIVHTGQHYDYELSDIFFNELKIPHPKYNISVGSKSHGHQTGIMLIEIEKILLEEKPDIVIVHGDTNSTIAGALAAVKLHIPLAHNEAGLRSFNRLMPEEHNRVVTDHVADILFVPGENAVKNLAKEGIVKNVYNVGDVMFDSILLFEKLSGNSKILDELKVAPKNFYLSTIHRAENTDNISNLVSIFTAFSKLDKKIILPLHPRTKGRIESNNIAIPGNVKVIQPAGYIDMITLMKNAEVILTDSGGIQKEAFYLKTPSVTLRNETEWIETIQLGWNLLAGADTERILESIDLVKKAEKFDKPVYGNGNTSEKIVEVLKAIL